MRAAVAGLRGGDPVPSRASIGTVVATAVCGDSLLASGLSYSVVDYYVRQLGTPTCLHSERFPATMLNWTGRLAATDPRTALDREAHQTVTRIAARGRPVWVFMASRGIGAEASQILEPQLQHTLACGPPLPLRGAFFDVVLQCEPS